MKSTETDVCYFEANAVFNGEPVELLEGGEYMNCKIEIDWWLNISVSFTSAEQSLLQKRTNWIKEARTRQK